jgi:hypothetical protein
MMSFVSGYQSCHDHGTNESNLENIAQIQKKGKAKHHYNKLV